jgi:hypothetical protein
VTGSWRKRAVPQEREARARRALDRTAAMLQAYRRNGLTMVAIEDVLTMLGTDPDAASPRQPLRDPRADPLTGAMWAGPPGTLPPGAQPLPSPLRDRPRPCSHSRGRTSAWGITGIWGAAAVYALEYRDAP